MERGSPGPVTLVVLIVRLSLVPSEVLPHHSLYRIATMRAVIVADLGVDDRSRVGW